MTKFIVLFLAVVALAQANLRPAHIEPRLPFRRLPFAKPSPRITGGVEVEPHSIPYQVGLLIESPDGTAFCGGSLLSPTTVVTAAHCGELSDNIEIVLGAHRIRETEDTQVRVRASQVIINPQWDSTTLENDIAILRIAEPVQLNENIQTIPLPTRAGAGNSYVDDIATASGWGLDSDGAEAISDVLRRIDVPVGSNSGCNIYYFGLIIDSHLCTDGANGKSTCSGDSGGPLRASTGELIGITSFGISFGCEIGWPAVFTRVTEFLDFIEENSDVVVN